MISRSLAGALFLLLTVFVTAARAQDCGETLGGIGGGECDGRRYQSKDRQTVELRAFHRLDYVRFSRVPLHPYTFFVHKPFTVADPDGGIAENQDESSWFFASIDVRFSTRDARLVLHQTSNIAGIWTAAPGVRPRDITGVSGAGSVALALAPGQIFVLKNAAGHFAVFTIKELRWVTAAAQPGGRLPSVPGRVDVGRSECDREIYSYLDLQVCDVIPNPADADSFWIPKFVER
jgi:hypothetical protein